MHQPRTPPPTRLRHLAALDGLRGVAVLAVLGYHAELAALPGGFLGVELFFVVSGFLITSLLLAEHRATGTIEWRRFWLRRARRLLPALAVVLATVAVVVRVALPDEVAATRGGLLAAVTYVTNWELVWSGRSYFESLGRPPLLQHLWSLAVEEQYYLLWPVAASLLLGLRGRRAVAWVCAAAAAGSTALMWVVLDPAAPSRVYYGTDTRAAGLAVGGLLATTLVGVRPPRPSAGARRLLDVVGGLALVAVVAAMATTSEYDLGLYRGGFLAFGLVTAVLLFVVAVPGSLVARGLAARPLVWVGLRSYGLYLWHWPVFQLTRPRLDLDLGSSGSVLALRLAVTVALAELSFRFVERPARDGAIGRWWAAAWGSGAVEGSRRARTAARLAVGGGLAATVALVGAYVMAPTPPSDAELAARLGVPGELADRSAAPSAGPTDRPSGAIDGRVHDTSEPGQATDATRRASGAPHRSTGGPPPPGPTGPTAEPAVAAEPAAAAEPASAPGAVQPAPAPTPVQPAGGGTVEPALPHPAAAAAAPEPAPAASPPPVHAVGDSVLLASAPALHEAFGGAVTVDAVVGRQPVDGVAAVEAWAPANPGVDLVVSLGSNGLLRDTDVDRVMAAAGPNRLVVWLTVAVPRRWAEPSNDVLHQRVSAHPNARLVDWQAQVAADPSLLGRDRVHPGAAGTRAFAAAVRAALERHP